jgi:hypothetical protein
MAHPLGRSKAESQALGVLTRFALWFQGQRRSFTGEQVASILLAGWDSYEESKGAKLPETLEELKP